MPGTTRLVGSFKLLSFIVTSDMIYLCIIHRRVLSALGYTFGADWPTGYGYSARPLWKHLRTAPSPPPAAGPPGALMAWLEGLGTCHPFGLMCYRVTG